MFNVWLGRLFYVFESVKKSYMHDYLSQKHVRRFAKCGKGVRLNGMSVISGHEQIELGDNVHIGDNGCIVGEGGLYIGDNVHISRNLMLYTSSHNYEGACLPYDDTHLLKKVYIGKNVWIGTNVTILPGTYIEEGCIIGAGAVVAGRLEAFSVYGACIAKQIKMRDQEHYHALVEKQSYGGANGVKLPKSSI